MLQLIRSSISCYWTVLFGLQLCCCLDQLSYLILSSDLVHFGMWSWFSAPVIVPDPSWLAYSDMDPPPLPTTHITVMMAWVWCWARGQVLLEKLLLFDWDCISWILFLVCWLPMFLFVFQVLKLLEVWNCWMVISYLVWISWIRRDNRFHILWENSCFKMTSCWIYVEKT